jgi:NAD(P)-dependent dehydrogenase (short-subunit alcohol dehydrogenase family)
MHILITGANRGIGLEFVRQYAAAGETVHACCRDPGKAAELKAVAGDVHVHALDVTDQASVDRLAAELKDAALHLLINNAGVYGGRDGQSLETMNFDAWAEVLAINTIAPLRVIKAFLPHLRKAGRGAKVMTISSQMGSFSRPAPGSIAYRSSKAAVNKVMQLVALDLGKDSIIACPLHPGWVRTDMGGQGADIDVEQSVAGLRQTINRLTHKDSGRFFQWDGKALEW